MLAPRRDGMPLPALPHAHPVKSNSHTVSIIVERPTFLILCPRSPPSSYHRRPPSTPLRTAFVIQLLEMGRWRRGRASAEEGRPGKREFRAIPASHPPFSCALLRLLSTQTCHCQVMSPFLWCCRGSNPLLPDQLLWVRFWPSFERCTRTACKWSCSVSRSQEKRD